MKKRRQTTNRLLESIIHHPSENIIMNNNMIDSDDLPVQRFTANIIPNEMAQKKQLFTSSGFKINSIYS
jgi:hypothetical protein